MSKSPQKSFTSRVGVILALALGLIVVAIASGSIITYTNYVQQQNMITDLREMSNSNHGDTINEVITNVQADMPRKKLSSFLAKPGVNSSSTPTAKIMAFLFLPKLPIFCVIFAI